MGALDSWRSCLAVGRVAASLSTELCCVHRMIEVEYTNYESSVTLFDRGFIDLADRS